MQDNWTDEAFASAWDGRHVAGNPTRPFLLSVIVSILSDMAAQRPSLSVLEIGSGSGLVTERILDAVPTATVDGADFSDPMMAPGRRHDWRGTAGGFALGCRSRTNSDEKQPVNRSLLHDHIREPVLPKWLDEGVCQWVSGSLGEIFAGEGVDTSGIEIARRPIPLRELSVSFPRDKDSLLQAYAQSRRFVDYLTSRYGKESLHGILNHLKEGGSIDQAIAKTVGKSLDRVEEEWLPFFEEVRSELQITRQPIIQTWQTNATTSTR